MTIRPPQRKRATSLSTVERDTGESITVPSYTQTHTVDESKTTPPHSVPVSTRTPCTVVECHSEKGARCGERKSVLLQSRLGTQGERQLRDGEAETEGDTKMTKSKLVSTSQHESSEEEVVDGEGTSSESDVLMDGESEESVWEETEPEYESDDGEVLESDSYTRILEAVAMSKLDSVGNQTGDTHTSTSSGPCIPLVTRLEHDEEVEPIERGRPLLDAKWKAKLEELKEFLNDHNAWPPKR
ncbi:hypothetical protein KIPB_012643, partial [Kipferlia bialata]|eukprot:g12643.t1